MGIYPIVIALVVYAGLYIFGVSGVILGPVSLLIVLECVRELWGETQQGEKSKRAE